MKDWKALTTAHGLPLDDAQLTRLQSVLEALEDSFLPLVDAIPLHLEPAVTLSEAAVVADSPEDAKH